jgi:hypothetical protein
MKDKKVYPIVEYARLIGKNTADFTVMDMEKFMKWYMSQKPKIKPKSKK